MHEELIISGRLNPKVDPLLHIWSWEIPLYLFLGGLAAGVLFFAAFYVIRGKEKEYPTAVVIAPLTAPFLLIAGLLALFVDLNNKLNFWRLYTTIRLESPMSWGAWTLLLITPLSIVWAGMHVKQILPSWKWRWEILDQWEKLLLYNRHFIAWVMLILSVILGIYTGILFSAFNARPLWNTSILGPLFLTSGLSTGAALIILLSKSPTERRHFIRLDLMIIGIELFLIIHMFMGFLASHQVQIDAARVFLGGVYTAPFWIFVVGVGLLLPFLLEVMELRKIRIPQILPPVLILFGGVMLRFIIAYAGQTSRWLY
jgi:protein NrfD